MGGSWLIRSRKEEVTNDTIDSEVTEQAGQSVMLADLLVDCMGNEVVDERLLELWMKGYVYSSDQQRRAFVEETLSESERAIFFQALAQRKTMRTHSGEPSEASSILDGTLTSPGSWPSLFSPDSPRARANPRPDSSQTSLDKPLTSEGSHIESLRRRAAEQATWRNQVEEAKDFLSMDADGVPRRGIISSDNTRAETKSLERRAAELVARRKQIEKADSFLVRRNAF